MIIETFVIGPFVMNCYIVASEQTRKAAIIDPGGDINTIVHALDERNLEPEKIINTHGHVDHLAGVKELQERLELPFYLHESDEWLLESLPVLSAEYGIPTQGIPKVDDYLNEGDIVAIGDISLKVLHTPGHSPGGVCFLAEEHIIVGDTLFAGSIGRTDLPGGDYDVLLHSIETKLLTLDDSLNTYCGHGPATTIGQERRSNRFLAALS